MSDLIDFIRARLDEDERVARDAEGALRHRWEAVEGEYGPGVKTTTEGYALGEPEWSRKCNAQVWQCDDEQDGCPDIARSLLAEAQHIARHDPARVLREVEAERLTIGWLEETERFMDRDDMSGHRLAGAVDVGYALRLRALRYSDHPDYRPEWRP